MKALLLSFVFTLFGSKPVPVFNLRGEVNMVMAAQIQVFLNENPGPVKISINSGGGEVTAGTIIEDAIEAHGHVTCDVRHGLAASMALNILESCQTRTMGISAILMAHRS